MSRKKITNLRANVQRELNKKQSRKKKSRTLFEKNQKKNLINPENLKQSYKSHKSRKNPMNPEKIP